MRSLLLVLLLSTSFFVVKAQDKIITIKKDTIECRIISINAERISYEQKISKGEIIGKSIAASDVLEYYRSSESTSSPGINGINREWLHPAHRLLLSIQGGLAHSMTDYGNIKDFLVNQGNPESGIDDYIKKLKNGYYISTELHYLLTSFLGVGATYSFANFTSDGNFLEAGYAGMNVPLYTNVELGEKLYYHFGGVSFLFQQSPDKQRKFRITETLSPGMVFLREETRSTFLQYYWDGTNYNGVLPQYYDNSNQLTKGNTFGMKGGLTFEYCITDQISAGLAGNFMWAKLKKVSVKNENTEVNDQELDNDVDISRFDYGFTLRYNF